MVTYILQMVQVTVVEFLSLTDCNYSLNPLNQTWID